MFFVFFLHEHQNTNDIKSQIQTASHMFSQENQSYLESSCKHGMIQTQENNSRLVSQISKCLDGSEISFSFAETESRKPQEKNRKQTWEVWERHETGQSDKMAQIDPESFFINDGFIMNISSYESVNASCKIGQNVQWSQSSDR